MSENITARSFDYDRFNATLEQQDRFITDWIKSKHDHEVPLWILPPVDLWTYDTESGIYTWIGGSNEDGASGIYGEKGVPSVNKIPGARSSSAFWTDEDGMMWLFGGYESFEYNNDLWKFNPFTDEWTWISGRNSQNIPGNYGTKGVPDPNNEIGSRRYTRGWVDNDGNFWIFGGAGIDSRGVLGYLNDLWKYNPETNIWTWMHGSDTTGAEGVYGTMGVPSPDNVPPPRYTYSAWTDDSGNLWMFGGYPSDYLQFNDLWKYDIRMNMWTWVAGSNDPEFWEASEYGTRGEGSLNNYIGTRERAAELNIEEIIKSDEKFLINFEDNGFENASILWSVNINRKAKICLSHSVTVVKGDASRRVFDIDGEGIRWAIFDSGIDAVF